jgi:hypothetical protein
LLRIEDPKMITSRCFASGLMCAILIAGSALPSAAASGRSPELLDRCVRMFQLWQRYETWHCPNPTGQRAQAEWAVYRCSVGDFDRGLPELTRLLRRDLIPLPRIQLSNLPASEERKVDAMAK